MTPKDIISRFSFGRMFTTDRLEMNPLVSNGVGALILEHKNGLRDITDDLTLVFQHPYEIDKLIEKLVELRDLMDGTANE